MEIRIRRRPKSLIGMILGLVLFGGIFTLADSLEIRKENYIPFAFGLLSIFPLILIIRMIIEGIGGEKKKFINDHMNYLIERGKSKQEARKLALEEYEDKKWIHNRMVMYENKKLQGEKFPGFRTSHERAIEDWREWKREQSK